MSAPPLSEHQALMAQLRLIEKDISRLKLQGEMLGLLQLKDELWTRKDVAKYLKVSEATLRRMLKLPGFPKKQLLPSGDNHCIERYDPKTIIAWAKHRKYNC